MNSECWLPFSIENQLPILRTIFLPLKIKIILNELIITYRNVDAFVIFATNSIEKIRTVFNRTLVHVLDHTAPKN